MRSSDAIFYRIFTESDSRVALKPQEMPKLRRLDTGRLFLPARLRTGSGVAADKNEGSMIPF